MKNRTTICWDHVGDELVGKCIATLDEGIAAALRDITRYQKSNFFFLDNF